MLVLSRKVGETIVVPECELSVTVLSIKGNIIKLGIAAPDDVEILRGELRDRLRDARPCLTVPARG